MAWSKPRVAKLLLRRSRRLWHGARMVNKLETQALTGATDKVGPWTIKAIALEARDNAITAARKQGLTVGQWLERGVRQLVEEDGFAPVANLSARPDAQALEELARVCGVMAAAGAPIPRSVTRLMWQRVRERLGAEPGHAPPRIAGSPVPIAPPRPPDGDHADQQHGGGEQ